MGDSTPDIHGSSAGAMAQERERAHRALEEANAALAQQADELRAAVELLERRTLAAESAQREAEIARTYVDRIFAQAPVAVAVHSGPDHVFTIANAAYTALVNERPLIGLSVCDALPELEGQGIHEVLDTVYTTGERAQITEMPLLLQRRADSPPEQRVFDFTYQPLRDTDGTVSGIAAVVVDVTDKVAARELVVASERQLRTLADAIPTLAWTARADGFIDWYNARWYEYTGTTLGDMAGWGWQSVHDPVQLPVVMERWRAGIASGEPLEITFPLRGADGTFRQFLTRVFPIRDAEGRVLRWFGTNTDVDAERTAREEAERAVDRTERLQALTEALAGVRTIGDVVNVVVAEASVVMGAGTAVLVLRQRGADRAVVAQHTGLTATLVDEWKTFDITHGGPTADCLRTGNAIYIESREGADGLFARYPEKHDVWRTLGTQALAALPLVLDGDVIGAMRFTFTEPRQFSVQDRAFFVSFARQCAQAVGRALLIVAEQEAIHAIEDRDTRLRFAMDIAALGAWDLNLATRTVWRSPRHDQIFGYEAMLPEWTYDMFLAHVVDEDRARVDADFSAALAGNTAWDFTCRIRRADGAERWITARGEPTGPQGKDDRLLGVVRDVTAERDAANALQAAKEEAEAANRSKSEFLAAMSHELRTPLNAIGGYAQILELEIHGPVNAAQRAALARIQHSEAHLLSVINDVLNFAKIEAGRLEYHMQNILLSEALSMILPLIEPQLVAKRIAHEIRVPSGVVVYADREKLQQVLLNLYSNSVKFTDPGGEVVADVAEREGAGEGAVFIRVCDTGIGIPRDKQHTIFDPFVQVHRNLTRTTEGTGLGLAISRDLARGMGGDLRVRSVEGQGSTFTLTLQRGR
ncbi:MAG: PAS domain-containing protein [bacterium]